jgi:nucleoside-diphosphate-sugar epimerase
VTRPDAIRSRTQTILGANGVIGRALSRELRAYPDRIRQVGRRPRAVHPTDELVSADLLDAKATADAVANSSIAYLVAGLKYDTKVWREQWPKVMRNVIDACKRHGTELVFFDNVYAYGLVDGLMTEDTPYNPCSRKGEVRARIATTLMDEVRRGELRGMIVRSADFYGPGAVLSVTHATVTERLRAGKTPQWIGNARAVHTFTYTPDAGRSVALLGNTPSAYGQVWHALTSEEPMTGERYARLACELAGRPYALQVAPRWMLQVMGLLSPVLRESIEMLYQFESDYRFDSGKLERAHGLAATPYREGIAAALKPGDG